MAQNKNMLIVNCAQGVRLIEMTDNSHNHNHEHEHEDDNNNDHFHSKDPHIWMSPQNAGIMVRNICDGLIQTDSKNRSFYEKNSDEYLKKLTEVDINIRNKLSSLTERKFAVFHPAFGYYAEEYHLTMVPVEKEGKEPTAESLAILIEQMKSDSIKIIFASPQFNPRSAEVIADEIDGKVVFIDALARDYINNLNSITNELVNAMR